MPNTITKLLTLSLILLSISNPTTPLPPPLHPQNPNTQFIAKNCATTQYPTLCIASLTSYAPTVKQNPVNLACVAANVTLVHLAALSSHVAAISGPHVGVEGQALRDCGELVGDAVDRAGQALGRLRGLDKAVGAEVSWRISDAQTWMSAAMTDVGTCGDGFVEVAESGVKEDVCGRVERVKEYTSNSLALINRLVNS